MKLSAMAIAIRNWIRDEAFWAMAIRDGIGRMQAIGARETWTDSLLAGNRTFFSLWS
jgi:hypothetical protein